jgi:hypothetical protein
MQIFNSNPNFGRTFNTQFNAPQQQQFINFGGPVNNSQILLSQNGGLVNNQVQFGQNNFMASSFNNNGGYGGYNGGSGFDAGGLSAQIQQMFGVFQMMISQLMQGGLGGPRQQRAPMMDHQFGGRGSGPEFCNNTCEVPTGPSIKDVPPAPYEGGKGGRFWGDPHLEGFDGEKYDVMGKDGNIYNMLSDKGVQYNTKFSKWGEGGATVISEAGIQVGKDQVRFDRSGKAPTVNGQALKKGQDVQLDNGGKAAWDGKKLEVNTGEYTIDLKSVKNEKGNYLDSNVKINEGGPFTDGVKPHGLLGQTADGVEGKKKGDLGKDQGKQGGTVIDGTVEDYQEADLFSRQSKYIRSNAQGGRAMPFFGNRNGGATAPQG